MLEERNGEKISSHLDQLQIPQALLKLVKIIYRKVVDEQYDLALTIKPTPDAWFTYTLQGRRAPLLDRHVPTRTWLWPLHGQRSSYPLWLVE